MRIHRITGLALLLALALAPLGLAQKSGGTTAEKKPAKKADKKTAPATETMPAAAAKPAGIAPLKFSDTKLANGLRVIIAEDHSAPVFGIAITYNVGSRNERPGRTGFAHLFEHMMFEGSENVGKGEHFILIENNGGGMNGTTNEDRTNYYEILPKNQLELALFLEADRMGRLAFTQEKLDNQRKAVQEERRLSYDNEPYGKSGLELDNLAYDNFSYKHSTIGEMSDLNAASLADVEDFFRIYYAPNNAVLTLVGDLDTQQTLTLANKYFGGFKAQTEPPHPNLAEPEHYGERRETIIDPLARLPLILIAYHIPAGNTSDNYAMQVLANILSTGRSSRLYQRLVKEKQLATSISVDPDSRIGPSMLYIQAMPRPGVKPEDLEKAIYDEIAAVQKDGVTAAELDKARTLERRSLIQARQSSLQTAMRLGQYAVYFNDPELINHIYDKFAAVNADQVKAAASKYLVPTERSVVITLPPAKPQAPATAGN
ncbi:MAG: insulinase family protein [Acidobacteriota bacterium]|nr:insulinase family protein [Acidobacteriota bacterium]